MEKGKVHAILKKVRQINPVVYNIISEHDACFTANSLLAFGASPIINGAVEEVAELTGKADAVILNINLPEQVLFNKITTVGKTANKHKIPLIYDAAGAISSSYRKQLSQQLLNEFSPSVIRGDAFEIVHLIEENSGKSAERIELNSNKCELALQAAIQLSAIIVITGREHIVSDGISTYIVHNSDALLAKLAASDSLLTAIIGSCAAVEKNLIEATVSALLYNGVAAEIAANKTEGQGPGNFQIEFINQLALISSSEIDLYGSFTKYLV
jgi:hydroxyethylthiazole kinase